MLFQIQKFGMVPIFLFMAVTQLFSQESNTSVVGSVTDANQQPLHHVHVIIKETGLGTYTDADGAYTILAKAGDLLLFSYVGMQDVEVRVKRSGALINLEMQAISVELEHLEVKVKRRIRGKTQNDLLVEYPSNKNLIKTSWGIIDKESSSIRMRIIDGKDLIPIGTDILSSIQNHYPQMHVDRTTGSVYFQKISYSSDPPVIFDVDGVIYVSPPIHLFVNDIDRVAILERNAGMVKYGPQGAGGVIVINTKAQTWMDDPGTNQQYDNRTLVDSLKREVSRLEAYRPYESSPIGKIHKAKTENQALALYAKEKKRYRNNPYYFLEVYDYFLSHWGNKEQLNEVFQHIIEGFKNDALVLKALAYLQQQHGHYKSALSLYLKILAGQYGNAQAHRDVANVHAEVGDFEKAMRTYTGYANDVCKLPHTPFDALGDDLLITTEMMNILERNEAFLGDKYTITRSTENSDTLSRLVFEWNNPAAEFEIHLMTPDGYYDTWSNVSPNSEAVPGYYSKQFFIGKENKRSWQVNIDYKGNGSEMPTYLKVSVYYNYGLTNQSNEIKVYKLSEHHEKVQLLVGDNAN